MIEDDRRFILICETSGHSAFCAFENPESRSSMSSWSGIGILIQHTHTPTAPTTASAIAPLPPPAVPPPPAPGAPPPAPRAELGRRRRHSGRWSWPCAAPWLPRRSRPAKSGRGRRKGRRRMKRSETCQRLLKLFLVNHHRTKE